ncbi:MAG: hypothetical protein LT067_01590 [Sulfurovum sp.]|nr:hypothetical protein [Sulfurovum sp.]
MIQYEGNGQINIFLSSGNTLYMTEDEMLEIHELASDYYDDPYLEDDEENNIKANKRPYNRKHRVMELYNSYKPASNSKAEAFRKIAEHLNITYKAVEKSFYKK